MDTILAVFEPDGSSVAEDLGAHLEAVWGRLEGFVKRVTEDAVQYTLGLVKSHLQYTLGLVTSRIKSASARIPL